VYTRHLAASRIAWRGPQLLGVTLLQFKAAGSRLYRGSFAALLYTRHLAASRIAWRGPQLFGATLLQFKAAGSRLYQGSL
jgi:hypothetical protein